MKYLYTLILLITLTSCSREEWLDIKPKGVVIPSEVSDYRLLLDQVLDRGISPGFGEAYANTDFMSDDFLITASVVNFTSNAEKRSYLWEDNFYDPNEEDNDWATLYGQIYVTNVVEEEIMDATGDMDEKLQLRAEARIQNAFAYFSLVNLYAVHYDPATASSILAVPFRNDTNIEDVQLPRATVAALYEHILDNINTSIEFLPDVPESDTYKNRPTKAGVYAFLARVYLYMGNYTEAINAANMALSFNNTLLDYNTVGDFFGILSLPQQQNNPEVIWFKKSPEPYRLLSVDPALYDTYEDGDIRKTQFGRLDLYYGIPGDDMVLLAPQFINERFTGFSVAEMLLIRAEGNARSGNIQEALDDINLLRQNRIETASYAPLASADQTEVLSWVLLQRRLEFVGKGLRFFDLKRFNQFHDAGIDLTHTLPTESETLTAGSNNWAVPVASKYILETPELGENIRD